MPSAFSPRGRPLRGIYLGAGFSHAVRKGQVLWPGQGVLPAVRAADEREEITAREPTPEQRALAEAALDAVPGGRERLLYARVDTVPGPAGAPLLLELELAEPSLFLGYNDAAAARLAAAVAARVATR